MTIKMTPILNSSNILAIGYDPATRVLRVAFKAGGTYDCHEVSAETYASLMSAESKGSFYAKQIKGKYPTTRVEETPKPA